MGRNPDFARSPFYGNHGMSPRNPEFRRFSNFAKFRNLGIRRPRPKSSDSPKNPNFGKSPKSGILGTCPEIVRNRN